jgi:hypothetical protein
MLLLKKIWLYQKNIGAEEFIQNNFSVKTV